MNTLKRFQQQIRDNNLFQPQDHLFIAVSGGLDSVVLCELCHQAGYQFTILHCNFQLRGSESDRDEQFVRAMAEKYKAIFLLRKFDTAGYAKEKKVSIQLAARELRYGWFKQELNIARAAQGGVNAYLLTAHHLDDNIETMLMNFFKGTGIAGLRSILPKQGDIIRPLLFAKKSELLRFANDQPLSWVEDSSNASDDYSRNFLRHQVLPLVQKIYPESESNLEGNIFRFREIELLYQQAIEVHKKKLVEIKGNEWHLPVLKLKKLIPLQSILFEIFKEFGFTSAQIRDVIALLDSDTGKFVASASHRIMKNRNWLILAPQANDLAETILIEEKIQSVSFRPSPGIEWKLDFAHQIKEQKNQHEKGLGIQDAKETALLDAAQIEFPIFLRKWKAGDYFYPLGMKKKKKISRFLIDQKLSKPEKENIWVLEMNRKIIWILDQRIDDRFKITPATQSFLKISISKRDNF